MPKLKHDSAKLVAFVRSQMKGKKLTELTSVFQMLSDLIRLRMLDLLLTQGKQSVNEICEKLNLRQPTVSHHLGLLRLHGLVENDKTGRNVYYSVAR